MRTLRFFALICTFMLTQTGISQNWFVGPELGMNIISINKGDLGNNMQLGFHGGANVEYKFNEFLSLRTGLFVSQKRQGYDSYDSSMINLFGLEDVLGLDGVNLNSYTQINGTVSQVYLQLPLMIGYTYERFSLFAGGYFGYMVSARTKETEAVDVPFLKVIDLDALGIDPTGGLLGSFLPPAETFSFTESSAKTGLNALDYGIKASARYEMDKLGINLNYLYGFADYQTITKSTKDNHSYFQLTLNYNFGIK